MTITVSPGDGLVTYERLKHLLELREEFDDLDFKREWNVNGDHHDKFLKTMAAMSSMKNGGYVIVGVSDDGEIVGLERNAVDDKVFDPANLGSIYKKYTGNDGIRSDVHLHNEKHLGIIYVPRSPDFFSVMEKPSRGTKDKFSQGDIFVRENTSNVKISKISANKLVEMIKQEVREETIKMLLSAGIDQRRSKDPIDFAQFVSTDSENQYKILQEKDGSEEISILGENLVELIFDSNEDFESDRTRNSLSTVLSFLLVHDEEAFKKLISYTAERYNSDLTTSESDIGYRKAKIAFEIIVIIEALGSLAIRRNKFDLVKFLVDVPVHIEGGYRYSSWLRHGIVMAARAGVISSSYDNVSKGPILISKAAEEIKDVQGLRPESKNSLDYERMKNSFLDSVVSFDLLWCMIVLDASKDESEYYPSWLFFEAERVVKIVRELSSNHLKRDLIFKDPSKENINKILLSLLENPSRFVNYSNSRTRIYESRMVIEAYQGSART